MTSLLTDREKEVLRLACFTKKEIGKFLNVSTTTVWTHFNNIYQKLYVSSKASALIEAIRMNEINIDEVETK